MRLPSGFFASDCQRPARKNLRQHWLRLGEKVFLSEANAMGSGRRERNGSWRAGSIQRAVAVRQRFFGPVSTHGAGRTLPAAPSPALPDVPGRTGTPANFAGNLLALSEIPCSAVIEERAGRRGATREHARQGSATERPISHSIGRAIPLSCQTPCQGHSAERKMEDWKDK